MEPETQAVEPSGPKPIRPHHLANAQRGARLRGAAQCPSDGAVDERGRGIVGGRHLALPLPGPAVRRVRGACEVARVRSAACRQRPRARGRACVPGGLRRQRRRRRRRRRGRRARQRRRRGCRARGALGRRRGGTSRPLVRNPRPAVVLVSAAAAGRRVAAVEGVLLVHCVGEVVGGLHRDREVDGESGGEARPPDGEETEFLLVSDSQFL